MFSEVLVAVFRHFENISAMMMMMMMSCYPDSTGPREQATNMYLAVNWHQDFVQEIRCLMWGHEQSWQELNTSCLLSHSAAI
jgi:hypothetical protein